MSSSSSSAAPPIEGDYYAEDAEDDDLSSNDDLTRELFGISSEEDDNDDEDIMHYAHLIHDTPLPVGRPWSAPERLETYQRIFDGTEAIVEILEDKYSVYDRKSIEAAHSAIFQKILCNVRSFIDAIPGQEDEYDNTPLCLMFMSACACLLSMGESRYYRKRADEIPFCVENSLVVTCTPIIHFNVQELI